MALCSPYRILVKHLARLASDHCPILLNLFECKADFKKLIRFEDIWISNPASSALVKKVWMKHTAGDYSQILNLKLRKTLKALFYWNKENNISLLNSKEIILGDILKLQDRECKDGLLSDEDSWLLKSKVSEYNYVLAKINTWWRQRAKIKWATQGDSNTKFFHTFASARKIANFINYIINNNGQLVEDQHQIEDSIVSFFENKWRDRTCNFDGWPNPISQLNEEEAFSLNTEFSLMELETIFMQAGNFTAPGFDGSIAWKIIKDGGASLKPIVRWEIANGRLTNVYSDIWILDKTLNKWPTFVNSLLHEDTNVDKLISGNLWNSAELNAYFGKELVDLIC
ncbi:uncharacterized protein LOC114580244 [Dendrobium catenatum]|uniref:uncharacterized protein LOC114580244 n=1 Tax=Dendrobium catenatum TaxID=906689 RepID=UPI00109F53A1|nr:uncharacterized protein LOC114580244 [Dendrobium catenatum]